MINFKTDERLKIRLPDLTRDWHEYPPHQQQRILIEWEKIRGTIPDRIKELEWEIETLLTDLSEEDDFERSCLINERISDRASAINDLWIWYRTNPEIHA
ncbi:hypothetical protein [Rossellomorea marisflavi]|uniref:Uncharacterized protein n=1 Tax=Rossellomorea marisflavi TaxID=189381 RepID=A0A0J5V9Y3_9BACI|nr:hypothetical protein [Rossellomorea marisflavi]KMK94074.1 hypothetical protein VL03_14710 [Rossellomorea marisflavi]KML07422.1 hypothetical protein VL06_05875 [Rossellomorea marisflavi]KML34457.1 hypothetical protein VL12_05555 [Rossellomorea marisflavi]KZE51883.1 hypothetical protein AV649_13820 [Rossellomorea marisflavi]MCM2604804.1 hypothetical protein [Rossellomorea marisflavi]